MNTLTNTYLGGTLAILVLGFGMLTFASEANADKVLMTIEDESNYTGDYLGVFESTDIGNPGEKCQPNTKEPANCLENKDYGSAPENLKLGVCIHGEVIGKEAYLRDVMNPVQDCDKNTLNMPVNCAGKKDYKPYCKFRTDDDERDASFKFSFMEESDGNKYLDCSVTGMHRRIKQLIPTCRKRGWKPVSFRPRQNRRNALWTKNPARPFHSFTETMRSSRSLFSAFLVRSDDSV